ncbi:capsid protein [Apis mellifera virus-6]|nr:capsid protein [Apis mellifera virus-6]QBX89271.1 capsid protein [Apis mellifera virus-6]QBX89273.1 capsid protein [Apis mellifera virus-6]
MRRRTFRRKRATKKNYRKKFRSLKSKVNTRDKISTSLGRGFPARIVMTHKYATHYTTNVSNTLNTIVMRANSVYDPEFALGGGSAMFYREMSALYNHYTVIGSKCKWTITRSGSNDEYSLYYASYIDDNGTAVPGSVLGITEQYGGKIKTISAGVAGGLNDKNTVINQKFSTRKYHGASPLNNSLIRADTTATVPNPAEQSYYILGLQTLNATSVGNVEVLIEMEYITVWTELKDITRS